MLRWNRELEGYGRAHPIRACHLALDIRKADKERAEAFYIERLNFRAVDVVKPLGVFLQAEGDWDQHNFLLMHRSDAYGVNHVAYECRDFDEVIEGGNYMIAKGWEEARYLGRHAVGSNIYRFFYTPSGGRCEYVCDMTRVDETYETPRIWEEAPPHHIWLLKPPKNATRPRWMTSRRAPSSPRRDGGTEPPADDDRASWPHVSMPTPGFVRVIAQGELADWPEPGPAAHMKVFLPDTPTGPVVRTYTVRDWDRERGAVTIDFSLNEGAGPATQWASRVVAGMRLELAGRSRSTFTPHGEAARYLFAGDETALPAIATCVAALPAAASATVILEVADAAEQQVLESNAQLDIRWLHKETMRTELRPRRVVSGDGHPTDLMCGSLVRQERSARFDGLCSTAVILPRG